MDEEDGGSHGELLVLLTAAHEAIREVQKFVNERRPKLDSHVVSEVPVAWRKHKSGLWAYTDYHPERADLARQHGWEPLFVAPNNRPT
jgi:hypothetical protein